MFYILKEKMMNIDELNKFFNRLKNDKKAMLILIIGLAGMLLILFSGSVNVFNKLFYLP